MKDLLIAVNPAGKVFGLAAVVSYDNEPCGGMGVSLFLRRIPKHVLSFKRQLEAVGNPSHVQSAAQPPEC